MRFSIFLVVVAFSLTSYADTKHYEKIKITEITCSPSLAYKSHGTCKIPAIKEKFVLTDYYEVSFLPLLLAAKSNNFPVTITLIDTEDPDIWQFKEITIH